MKNFKKRAIAVAALMCVTLSVFSGCGDSSKNKSNDSSSKNSNSAEDEEPIVVSPFTWGAAADSGLTAPDVDDVTDAIDLSGDDPVKKGDTVDPHVEISTELVAVLDENGEPVMEVVEATDSSGQVVTEANGQPVTEVVPKVQVVEVTQASQESATGYVATGGSGGGNSSNNTTAANNNNSNNNGSVGGGSEDATDAASDYVPHTDGMYAMWIDISKNENFYFEDSFIRITFKVKDDIPDGNYDVTISPDLSSIAGVTINPDSVYRGTVTVGDTADTVDVSGESGLVIYGDKVSANQGDTVDVCLNIKNNPGLAAMCVWFYYDSNALEIVDCIPDGQFADIAGSSTQINTKPNN